MSPNQTSHEIMEVYPLVASSTPYANSSIGTASSPTLLTPESLLHEVRSSLSSSHGTPTVKFAPLPQINPNRKRSLAPLGVSARSRRKRDIQQEGGSLLWSTALDTPEEDLEDPIIVFAKFMKRTGKSLWRRVRLGGRAVLQEDVSHPAEHILDISSAVRVGDMALSERDQHVLEGDQRGRRASWSPSAGRRTLSQDETTTSDLSCCSVTP